MRISEGVIIMAGICFLPAMIMLIMPYRVFFTNPGFL